MAGGEGLAFTEQTFVFGLQMNAKKTESGGNRWYICLQPKGKMEVLVCLQSRLRGLRMRRQTIVLLLVFVSGLALLSATFKIAQTPQRGEVPSFTDPALTERQRVYLDRQDQLAKWLVALSYGVLAGLVTKRLSAEDARFNTFSCGLGGVLLVLSLYAGFLSFESILILMSLQPLWAIGSHLTSYPLAAQMILLAAGTTSLAFAFLGPNKEGGPGRGAR